MKETIKNCPKTYEAYKKWMLDGLKKKYPKQEMFATVNLIELSIKSTPMSMAYYFDTLGMVGTLHYNKLDREFLLCVNADVINVHEDHQWSNDRKEAEENLIKYLFVECEKTI